MERIKQSGLKSFWDSSKPKPGEEGALGPVDTWNRASYRFSKPAFFITSTALLIGIPLAGIATLASGVWAGGDKMQIEGSKWLRRKIKGGDLKPGQAIDPNKN